MEETQHILADIRSYIRIAAAQASRENAKKAIDTLEKAKVYSMLDGNTPQSRIESNLHIPHQTISRWVTEFVEARLVSPPNEFYKNHRALFTLSELGINMSQLKKRKEKGEAAEARVEKEGELLD